MTINVFDNGTLEATFSILNTLPVIKVAVTNFVPVSGPSPNGLPTGGNNNEFLRKSGSANYSATWAPFNSTDVSSALGFTPYDAANPAGYLSTVSFAGLTGKPTTLSGYGITDGYPLVGNPSGFLTSVPAQSFSSLTGKPSTLSGYGITDAYPLVGNPSAFLTSITSAQVTGALGFTPYNATNPAGYITSVPAQSFASLTGKPTTLSGYGITDAYPLTGNPSNFLTSVPAQSFSSLTGKPTTLSGYGITDAYASSNPSGYVAQAGVLTSPLTGYTSGAGTISSSDTVLGAIQKLNGNIAASVSGVSSVFGRSGAVTAASGDYTTSLVTEGSNLYFTNARGIAATLTGYTSGAGTVAATDSVLAAIQKINGNVSALVTGVSSVFGRTGAVVAGSSDYTTSQVAEGSNLYYTNARGIASVLTGFSAGAGTIAATDTVLQGLQKNAGNIAALVTGVSSVFGRTGAVTATSGDYTTSQVTEGSGLYFTNARAIAATLTGYTSGAGTVAATDSVLAAIQKINGNVSGLTTSNVAEGSNLYFTNARGIGSTLTSYSSGAGTVSATDTVLSALQKLDGNDAMRVPTTRTVSTTSPLTGGGDLSANRTLAWDFSVANTWTGLQTFSGGATTGTNFTANGGAAAVSSAATNLQISSATATFNRVSLGSATTTVLTTGASAANLMIGSTPFTTFTSGTHGWIVNLAVNAPGTITAGGATLSNTACVYIGTAGTGGTSNYSLYVAGSTSLATTLGVAGTSTFTGRTTHNGGLSIAAGTSTVSQITLATGTAKTTPVEGDIWNDSTAKAMTSYVGGIQGWEQRTVGVFTSSATANTTSETSVIGTVVGTKTFPANFWVVGKTIRIRNDGVFTTGATPANVTVKVKLGSTVVASGTINNLTVSATNAAFSGEGIITCRSTGTTGTVSIAGSLSFEAVNTGVSSRFVLDLNNGGAVATIDTTASQVLDLTVTLSATGTSITGTTGIVTILN